MAESRIESSLSERLLPAVQRVMTVFEVTEGAARDRFRARFRGRLRLPADEAFREVETAFAANQLTPSMHAQDGETYILAHQNLVSKRRSNPVINLILFLLTVMSTVFAGALYVVEISETASSVEVLRAVWQQMPKGIPFAVSLLAILLAHEFGHYIAARRNGTAVTLPYFLPFPGSPFGTLGAVIQLKSPPRDRRALLDIAIAGPLAGLAVTIPVLLIGLSLSEVGTLPLSAARAFSLEGNSILYLAAKFLVKGELLPAPVDYAGISPLLYWVKFFFLGSPIPFGGRDVLLHPVAWAGWAGLLVTAMNLIPVGQLDGGHLVFGLFGRRASRLWVFVMAALVVLGMVWSGWWLWAAMVFFLGRAHAQPLNDLPVLDRRRKWLAVIGLLVFLLVFTPVPLVAIGF